VTNFSVIGMGSDIFITNSIKKRLKQKFIIEIRHSGRGFERHEKLGLDLKTFLEECWINITKY